jgi:hypothetical protein
MNQAPKLITCRVERHQGVIAKVTGQVIVPQEFNHFPARIPWTAIEG